MRCLQLALVGALALVLTACAGVPTPETSRERLVAAEVTYGAVLENVRSLVTSGVIESGSDTGDRVAVLLVETRAALDAWQSDPDNPNLANMAVEVLERLRLMLLTTQQSSLLIVAYPEGLVTA